MSTEYFIIYILFIRSKVRSSMFVRVRKRQNFNLDCFYAELMFSFIIEAEEPREINFKENIFLNFFPIIIKKYRNKYV